MRKLSGLFNGIAAVATASGVAASLGIGALQITNGKRSAPHSPVMPWRS